MTSRSNVAVHVDEDAGAGRAVMLAAAQRLEQRIAGQFGHEIAGDAADRAETRGAGLGGARPSLVVVTVTDDADAIAHLERIVQDPLERAPGRVHFDCAFQLSVMGVFDVGIASADMGDHDGVLAGQRLE